MTQAKRSPVVTNAIGIRSVIGALPYRMAFAGGWIDQPFVSKLNPDGVGSMVVVAIHPDCRFMDRCGMGTSTRRIATQLWGDTLPDRDPMALTRELYEVENQDQPEPSGSQDMIGLIYPGVNRLDYDYDHEGGTFPVHVESNNDRDVADWLQRVITMVPVAQRPAGYNPLGIKNLDPKWIRRLGQSGKHCYDAIIHRDAAALGASMNECMLCWETILPHTVRHPTIKVDLMALLKHYQDRYAGAMYSGCGGGYIYVVSDEPVPGGFHVRVRTRGAAA
ncbi:MAG: hypothetical protein J7M39_10215 [Anaerolineae bacterium]|nr:hypothetical protein [Anaerolineae bacterium]